MCFWWSKALRASSSCSGNIVGGGGGGVVNVSACLPAGMHSGLVCPMNNRRSSRLSISSAVSSHLGMELGGRWRTESRGGDGWIMAPSPPMNEDVINSSCWKARVFINGGGGFTGRVRVESSLSEYNIDESQQNFPPRFLKMIRTWMKSTEIRKMNSRNTFQIDYLRTSGLKAGQCTPWRRF